jgi:Flp pilus assembly pilin Flp
MKNTLKRLWDEEEAANAVEYGLITAVIAAALILVLVAFRNQLRGLFTRTGTQVGTADQRQ